jgi:hypothetical protein
MTVTKTLILTWTPTLTEDTMKTAAASGRQVHTWSRPQGTWNSGGVCAFRGGHSGLRIQEVPHMKKDSTPFIVFLLFCMEVIQLLVAETNKYYNQYLDMLKTDGRGDCTRDVHLFGHNNQYKWDLISRIH